MKEQHQSRFRVPFQSQWKMRIDHPYSLWVRDGEVGWSCGQCPLDPRGEVVAPGDLRAQTRFVIDMIEANLQLGQLGSGGAAKLMIYYVPDETSAAVLEQVGRRLACAVLIVPVAVPHFYYEGMLVEIDVFCSGAAPALKSYASTDIGPRISIIAGGALAHGKIEFSRDCLGRPGAWPQARVAFDGAMAEHGLSSGQLLSGHWFVDRSAAASVLLAQAAGDELCRDPGAAVVIEAPGSVAALGAFTFVGATTFSPSTELRDGNAALRRRGRFFCATARGSGDPASLNQQTMACMEGLHALLDRSELDFDDVCKATTLYAGGSSASALHENMSIRNRFYRSPGPASTGIPVTGFGDHHSLVTIDLIGTAREAVPARSGNQYTDIFDFGDRSGGV
jgi:enamine deaminase RidA (YjgF/YER057c/UK114 family)